MVHANNHQMSVMAIWIAGFTVEAFELPTDCNQS